MSTYEDTTTIADAHMIITDYLKCHPEATRVGQHIININGINRYVHFNQLADEHVSVLIDAIANTMTKYHGHYAQVSGGQLALTI